MKKKIVIYARFSSHTQTEQSIEGQLRECHYYAEKNNYEIICEYIDRAISGTTDKRPQFLQMIEDSKKREFEYVLVYQLDRFARNRYDSANYKMKLKKNGIRVLSARENISDDASGILIESVLEGMAEYYSAELSQKVKRGIKETMLKGNHLGGIPPIGYKQENRKLIVDTKTAPIVRKIFKEFLKDGATIKSVCDLLRENNIKNRTKKYFNLNQISKILRNKRFTGVVEYDNEVYENVYPAIIKIETFEKVRVKLKTRNYKREITENMFILNNKIFCGYCNNKCISDGGKSKNKKIFRYYTCHTKRKLQVDCELKSQRKEIFEDLIIKNIYDNLLNLKMINQILTEMFPLKGRMALEKRAMIKENKMAYENFLISFMSYPLSSNEEKSKLINNLVDKIIVFNDRYIISFYSPQTEPITIDELKSLCGYFNTNNYSLLGNYEISQNKPRHRTINHNNIIIMEERLK